MTAQCCLLLSDGKDQRSVYIESCNRSPPGRRQAHKVNPFPAEMFRPDITSRIKQSNPLASLWIKGRLSRCFAQRTEGANTVPLKLSRVDPLGTIL